MEPPSVTSSDGNHPSVERGDGGRMVLSHHHGFPGPSRGDVDQCPTPRRSRVGGALINITPTRPRKPVVVGEDHSSTITPFDREVVSIAGGNTWGLHEDGSCLRGYVLLWKQPFVGQLWSKGCEQNSDCVQDCTVRPSLAKERILNRWQLVELRCDSMGFGGKILFR